MASRSGKGKKGGPGKKKKSGKVLSAEDGWKSEQLGRLGEKTLELWAAQGNFTAHRSTPDIHGWDYYIQIRDRNAKPTPPFDAVPVRQTCKLQVKTLSEHTGKCVLKLSTLREMTDPTIPWFVLALVSKDGLTVDSAHLLHIHGDRLAEILKRLRKHKAGRPLSSATITFEWDESDELTPATAQTFEERVGRAIGDPEQYLGAKRKFVSTVGFGPFKGSITIKTADEGGVYEAMSLFAIGQRDSLDLSEYSVNEVRFGISKPKRAVTDAQDPKLLFSAGTPFLKGRFEVSGSDESVSFDCDFYSTVGVFPFLPPEFVKYRFVAGPLSIVFLPDARINLAFDAESESPWSVDLLGRIGKAIRIMRHGATISVAVGDGAPSPAARIKHAATLEPDLAGGLAMCEVARDLIHRAGESADLPVRIKEIVKYQQELGFVSAALNPMLFNIEALNLGPSSVADAEFQAGKDLDAFVGPFVVVGGKTIAPLIVLEGVASKDPESGETRVEKPAVRLLKIKTLGAGESGKAWWEKEQAQVKGRPGAFVAKIDPPYA